MICAWTGAGGMTAAELVNEADEAGAGEFDFSLWRGSGIAPDCAGDCSGACGKSGLRPRWRLAAIVERAKGGRKGRKTHPATQTFQALRMAVNDELAGIEQVLESMIGRMADGGRIAVLTFHSLEDRLVKQFFNRHVPREESLQQGGVRRIFEEPPATWIWKKPKTATAEELEVNPRSTIGQVARGARGGTEWQLDEKTAERKRKTRCRCRFPWCLRMCWCWSPFWA